MSYKLLSAIFKSPWFIDPGYVESHMPIIIAILERKDIRSSVPKDENLIEDENIQPYIIAEGRVIEVKGSLRKGADYNTVPKGSIAVIPVKGPLMKEDEDDCGYFTAGTATISKRIREADEHQNISGIILHLDTPGGTIDGIHAFADTIKATKKPIVGFIDGMCASAGMYAASTCDSIIAENITAEAGSIGVMMGFVDTKPYLEKLGYKYHEIYSTLSPDKNREYREALEGKYDLMQKEGLDPFAKIFQDQIRANRPKVKEDSMTGKMYLAVEALERGLIDGIGGIELAVEKVNELANARATASDTKPKSKIEMKQFALLNALLGIEMLESTEEGAYLNEEQLQAIEDRLAATAKAEQDLATAQESLSAANKNLETANASIEDLNGRITEMAKGPAEKPASVKTDTNAVEAGEEDLNAFCEKNDTATAVAKMLELGIN